MPLIKIDQDSLMAAVEQLLHAEEFVEPASEVSTLIRQASNVLAKAINDHLRSEMRDDVDMMEDKEDDQQEKKTMRNSANPRDPRKPKKPRMERVNTEDSRKEVLYAKLHTTLFKEANRAAGLLEPVTHILYDATVLDLEGIQCLQKCRVQHMVLPSILRMNIESKFDAAQEIIKSLIKWIQHITFIMALSTSAPTNPEHKPIDPWIVTIDTLKDVAKIIHDKHMLTLYDPITDRENDGPFSSRRATTATLTFKETVKKFMEQVNLECAYADSFKIPTHRK